jgi:hypothetical protein
MRQLWTADLCEYIMPCHPVGVSPILQWQRDPYGVTECLSSQASLLNQLHK